MLRNVLIPLATIALGMWLTPANAQVVGAQGTCPTQQDANQPTQDLGYNSAEHAQNWLVTRTGECPQIDIFFANADATVELGLYIFLGDTVLSPGSAIYSMKWDSTDADAGWNEIHLTGVVPTLLKGNHYTFLVTDSTGLGNQLSISNTSDQYDWGHCLTCPGQDTTLEDMVFRTHFRNAPPTIPDTIPDWECWSIDPVYQDEVTLDAEESTGWYMWYTTDTTFIDSTIEGEGGYDTLIRSNTRFLVTAHDREGCESDLVPIVYEIHNVTFNDSVVDLLCHHDMSGEIHMEITHTNGLDIIDYDWYLLEGSAMHQDAADGQMGSQTDSSWLDTLYQGRYGWKYTIQNIVGS